MWHTTTRLGLSFTCLISPIKLLGSWHMHTTNGGMRLSLNSKFVTKQVVFWCRFGEFCRLLKSFEVILSKNHRQLLIRGFFLSKLVIFNWFRALFFLIFWLSGLFHGHTHESCNLWQVETLSGCRQKLRACQPRVLEKIHRPVKSQKKAIKRLAKFLGLQNRHTWAVK